MRRPGGSAPLAGSRRVIDASDTVGLVPARRVGGAPVAGRRPSALRRPASLSTASRTAPARPTNADLRPTGAFASAASFSAPASAAPPPADMHDARTASASSRRGADLFEARGERDGTRPVLHFSRRRVLARDPESEVAMPRRPDRRDGLRPGRRVLEGKIDNMPSFGCFNPVDLTQIIYRTDRCSKGRTSTPGRRCP